MTRMPDNVPPTGTIRRNIDEDTVASFGDEWSTFDQARLSYEEQRQIFEDYFRIFPWHTLPRDAEGFDMGCGSGRWAKLVAPRVGLLRCVDASAEALTVARANLVGTHNAHFVHATIDAVPIPEASQDFGYSLGVLHHIPDTAAGLAACVRLLKPGAPFLLYLYYRFDNRPWWFRYLWRISDVLRQSISALPAPTKRIITDAIAVAIYWPLARLSAFGQKVGVNTRNFPLHYYRDASFYTMRTDSRDRFGTPLEQRFTRDEIRALMQEAGLVDVIFSDAPPYWCAVGSRAR